ncbi:extensin family protein [Paracoccus sp. p3-h83]|uniref:extensin-like domain-containing protein n=1 Tax=Paracoccus sp. p3-h83 TaxID=3342805 RepID=UPI0035B6EEED
MRKIWFLAGMLAAIGACGFGGRHVGTGAPAIGNGICGTRSVIGERIAPIQQGACGIANPVRITSVAGVRLSQPATLDCQTVRALEQWTVDTAIPAVGGSRGGLAELTVAASYACRGRNRQAGARMSEHGLGKAIDISGFVTGDGTRVTVEGDWGFFGRAARVLKQMRGGACGTFGTVLGPGSDAYHHDHLHLDVAQYRSGPYCK